MRALPKAILLYEDWCGSIFRVKGFPCVWANEFVIVWVWECYWVYKSFVIVSLYVWSSYLWEVVRFDWKWFQSMSLIVIFLWDRNHIFYNLSIWVWNVVMKTWILVIVLYLTRTCICRVTIILMMRDGDNEFWLV